MSGYFTDGKPSPGVHAPQLLPDYDPEESPVTEEATKPPPVKNYDSMKNNGGGKHIVIYRFMLIVEQSLIDISGISFKRQYFRSSQIVLWPTHAWDDTCLLMYV